MGKGGRHSQRCNKGASHNAKCRVYTREGTAGGENCGWDLEMELRRWKGSGVRMRSVSSPAASRPGASWAHQVTEAPASRL